MADTTGIRNVVISLDLDNSQVKLMKILGTSFEDSVIEFLPFDKKYYPPTEYDQMLLAGLRTYIEKANLNFVNYYLVLPDELFAMWRIVIPSFSKVKVEDVLKEELKKDLGDDYNKFQTNTTLLYQDKANQVFFAEAINLDMLNKIKKALADIGIAPKSIVSRSVSVVNAVQELRVRARQGVYALVDIRKNSTTLAYVNQNNSFGNISLPFGYEILRTDRFVDEDLLFNHDSATIVLSHALETTTNFANREEEENEALQNTLNTMELGEMTSTNDPGILKEEQEEAQKRFDEAEKYIMENTNDFDNTSDIKEEPKIEDTHSITNKLYETRNTLELQPLSSTYDLHITGGLRSTDSLSTTGITLRDNVLANFRIFMKQINLFVENCNSGFPSVPKIEYILVNIPKRYSFLLTKANSERGNSAEYKYFNPTVEDNPTFTENLDLYGVLLSKNCNSNKVHS